MMMIMGGGENNFHSNPTVQVPPWDDPTDHNHHHTNHLNHVNTVFFDDLEMLGYDDVLDYDDVGDVVNSIPPDVFSGDHFRMYEFKVRRCARGRSHDWTDCPYAHPGEKARRRDPRKFHYAGNPCPEFRKGACGKGDTCDLAHGVFECWLHPSRYRTQPCKDGVHCRRRICFFAHTPEQLRVLSLSQPGLSPSQTGLSQPDSYDGSPSRFSPTSTLYHPSTFSPPMSPIGQHAVNELASSLRNLQIGNTTRLCLNSLIGSGSGSLTGSGLVTGSAPGTGFGSPRSLSLLRPGLSQGQTSLPTTPTRGLTRDPNGDPTRNAFDLWDPVMERVESGKEIRAKMYAKLSRENSLVGRVE